MKQLIRRIVLCLSLSLLVVALPASAADFGDAKDVKAVRKLVSSKFGKALHASVSHDWALCTAFQDESDLSIVLHRADGSWKVVQSDGGAFDASLLKGMGVPPGDVAALLKAYQ